jgi:biopolymer transport protein TolR
MSFGRLERSRAALPMSEINVTPLVDVMLVLLVIFMLTAPFMASALRLELPRASAASTPSAAASPLRVEVDALGQVRLNGLAVDAAQLAQRLAEAAAAQPDAEVQLRADQAVPYGRVVELMDAAHRAGLSRIAFVARSAPAAR